MKESMIGDWLLNIILKIKNSNNSLHTFPQSSWWCLVVVCCQSAPFSSLPSTSTALQGSSTGIRHSPRSLPRFQSSWSSLWILTSGSKAASLLLWRRIFFPRSTGPHGQTHSPPQKRPAASQARWSGARGSSPNTLPLFLWTFAVKTW